MPECQLMSKTYNQLEVLPGGARTIGLMELMQKSHGFYMTALTAAMIAEHPLGAAQPMTLITEAENVRVIKTAGSAWVAGDWIYWDEAASAFTNVPAADLYCVGKAQRAAAIAAVLGFVTFQDNLHPIQLGTTALPITIVAGNVFNMHVTSSQTAGNAEPFVVETILTGVGATGGRALFELTSEVVLGGWINSLKGIFRMGASAQVQGLGSAICAELVLPTDGLDRGTLTCLELEMVCAGTGPAAHATSLIFAEVSGAQKAEFNTNGFFLDFVGEVEGSGALWDTDETGDTPTGGLRCRVNGAIRHLSYI